MSASSAAAVTAVVIAEEQRKQTLYLFSAIINNRRKKRKEAKNMAIAKMIQDLIGKTVKLTTINKIYKGKIVEIQDEWIRIETSNHVSHYIREDMIIGISEK